MLAAFRHAGIPHMREKSDHAGCRKPDWHGAALFNLNGVRHVCVVGVLARGVGGELSHHHSVACRQLVNGGDLCGVVTEAV